jgi:type VI secretion system protein ImpH
MAGENRDPGAAVALGEAIAREPWKFHFFQALRRLECAYPDRPRLGESVRASVDPVRLGQDPSMTFAPAMLSGFESRGDGLPPRLGVLFLGLFGPNGPLPLHLTEYAYDRRHNAHDPTLMHFADVFHHRLLSLFYRAWASAQPHVQFDRPGEDRYAFHLGALIGLGLGSLRERDALPDAFRLHHAGHLACRTRPPEMLASMLADFLRVPARVEEFHGHWLRLPRELQCRLGESIDTGRLGVNATIGERVWDVQSRFRIVLGPVGYETFQRFLPGGESLERVNALVRGWIDREFEWDLQVVLLQDEVPGVRLGKLGRLGWTSWLLAGSAAGDADDYVVTPERATTSEAALSLAGI